MKDLIKIKRFVDTNFKTIIDRTSFFYTDEVTVKGVKEYLSQLKEEKDCIQKAFNVIDTPFNLESDFIDKFLNAFDDEIKLAEFYLELSKVKKNPSFDKWVYFTEEEFNKEVKNDWNKRQGNVWVRTNGRIKATIRIKDNVSSINVNLIIDNDSEMAFVEKRKELYSSNLRNKESIKKKIEDYKFLGEVQLKNIVFPMYGHEKRRFDCFKKLLQLELKED